MNPDFVAVTGGSAGGHLTALMGLTENRPDLQPGQEGVDTSVQACVPFYGVYDFLNRSGARASSAKFLEFLGERVMHATPEQNPALWDLASPVTQIHADAPPFMVVHGSRDSLAPVADARLFTRRLRETSRNPVVYVELQGAEHAFDIMHSPRTEHAIDGVQRFLEWVRARHVAATDRQGVASQHSAVARAARAHARPGSSRRGREKRHAKGFRTARENLDDLVDPGSFLEYGQLAVAAQRNRRDYEVSCSPRRRPTASSPASAPSMRRGR